MANTRSIQAAGIEMGRRLKKVGRAEDVDYHHRATQDATAVNHTIRNVIFGSYDALQIDAVEVLRTDQRFSVPVGAITFRPTRHDTLTRPDGTVWAVKNVSGGPGHAFWFLQGGQRG